MLDFTQCDWIDLTKLTRYHQNLMTFLSDNYLNKSGGTMNGQINSCSILPKSPSSYNLGSSTNQWSNIYSNGFVLVDSTGQIRPNSTGTGSIGTSSYYWGYAYINNITSGTIIPKTDNTYDIGSSTYKWKDAYINNLHGTADEIASTALSMPTGSILRLSAKGCTTASIAQENGVIDVSGNGNHGRAYNGVQVVQDSEMGACYSFDSSVSATQYLKINKTIDYSNDFSFYFSVKGTDFSHQYITFIDTRTLSMNENFIICLESASSFKIIFYALTSHDRYIAYKSTAVLNLNFKYDIAITFNYTNSQLKIYINGTLDSTHTITSTRNFISVDNTFIGNQVWLYTNMNIGGKISDIRIYPYALTPTQVKSLYMNGDDSIFGNLTADLIGTNVIKAKNLVKTEALITETAQISQAIVKDLVVTNGVTIGDLNTTAQNANNKIDNLQVGGRNLLKNSNVNYSHSTTMNHAMFTLYYGDYKPNTGDTVTLSIKLPNCDWDNYVGSILMSFGFPNSKYKYITKARLIANDIYAITFEFLETSSNGVTFQVNRINTGTSYTIVVDWVKLEYGNVATTYSPAPEDTDSLIATAQGKADSAYSNNQVTQTQLDNLQVGGRNLLKNSNNGGNGWNNTDFYIAFLYFGDIKPKTNDIVTIQIKGQLQEGLRFNINTISGSSSYLVYASITSDDLKNGIYVKTFTLNSNIDKPDTTGIIIVQSGSITTGSTIDWVKLEFGNQATTWTPAPEDVDADISTAQTTADNALPKAGGTMTGTINSQSIIPKTTDTYNLGSSTYKWENAYINNIWSGSICPKTNNRYSLGSGTSYWAGAYINNITSCLIEPKLENACSLGTGASYWANAYINNISSGNIVPKTDNTYNLGSDIFYWGNAYINNINSKYIECLTTETLNSTVYNSGRLYLKTANRKCELTFYTFNGTSYIPVSLKAQNGVAQFNVQGSFVPNSSATYDLGSTDYRWNIVYAKNGYATNGWSTSCDEKLKRDIKDVNVLDKLKNLRVKKFKYSQKAIKEKQWNEEEDKKMFSELSKGNRNYKRPETPKFEDDENSPDYIMAMAGEFNKAFGLDGDNEDTINYTNAIGVALRAIQELSEQVDELKRKLNEKNKK